MSSGARIRVARLLATRVLAMQGIKQDEEKMADIATLISILAIPKAAGPSFQRMRSRDLEIGDIVEDSEGKRAIVVPYHNDPTDKVFTDGTKGMWRHDWYDAVKVGTLTGAEDTVGQARRLHTLNNEDMRGALILHEGSVYVCTYGMGLQDFDGDEIYAMTLDGREQYFDRSIRGVLLYQSEQATVTHETPATAEIRAKEDGC